MTNSPVVAVSLLSFIISPQASPRCLLVPRMFYKSFKPSWSNHAPHSTCSLAVIVEGAVWDSCRTIVLLIDGKTLIKPKIVLGKLLERSKGAICLKKFSHLCHTLARSYFECLADAGCLSAKRKHTWSIY